MLITDKKNKDYVFVTLEDVMSALSEVDDKAAKEELKILFNKESYNEMNRIRVSKKSKVYEILKDCDSIIKGDEYIDSNMLAIALARSIYEFNHPMKQKLTQYFRSYMDNVKEQKSNEMLIHKMLCDEELIEYIRKYDKLEDFEKHLIDKQLRKKEVKKENPEKGKSYVMID